MVHRERLNVAHGLAAAMREPVLLIVLAALTGIVGGLGAVLFRLMIAAAGWGFHHLIGPLSHLWSPSLVVLPALGLLLVGVITTYFAREVKGHGVPQILEALALRGGRIRPRVGLFGILAPAITIGAGGSVGREGPIALIGAAFGSSLGQLFRLSDRYIMLLVGCGAAAGIGATFNAPIAGALFGMEVVLGSYAMGTLVPCFVASVVGVTAFHVLMGNHLVLPVSHLGFRSSFSIVVMALLGVAAGLFAILYTRGLTWFEDLFDHRWSLAFWQKAIIGGLAVGLLGLAWPQVLGVGYGPMQAVASGSIAGVTVLALLVAKYLATLTTIGAGGSGGVFAPSLYLGLMLGTTLGAVAHDLFPHTLAVAAVFGVAGMGAVFAAAAQAPLTAVVIVLEMTGDYRLTLGVAMASAIAYMVYGSLQRDTMYTVRLSRRGIRILRGAEVRPLQSLAVARAMRPLGTPLTVSATLHDAQAAMGQEHLDALVIAADDRTYAGVLQAPTVLAASTEGGLARPIGEVSLTHVPPLTPHDSLEVAMRRFALYDTDILPVEDGGRLVGMLTRGDVLHAYQMQTALSLETDQRLDLLRNEALTPGALEVLTVLPGSAAVGRAVRDLPLPRDLVIVVIERAGTTVVPRGDTVIAADDRLVVYAQTADDLEAFRRYASRPAPA